MATNYKILGQVAPLTTTNTDVYTVPSNTEVIVSSITIANRGTAGATYRIAVRPDAQPIASTHYITYDAVIEPTDTVILTAGITANAGDVFTVYATTADLTFGLFGSELT